MKKIEFLLIFIFFSKYLYYYYVKSVNIINLIVDFHM